MNLSRGTPWRKRRPSRGLSMISYQGDITMNVMNCFIDLPRQVFSLTYLEDNQTQNPESLGSLEEFRKRNWLTYLVGYLHNFSYEESQINGFKKALDYTINYAAPPENDFKYVCEVTVTEDLSPTENDSSALVITVFKESEEEEKGKEKVFTGYLMSWCNPVKASRTLLPLMLCDGRKSIRIAVLEVLCKQFDTLAKPLILMQEDIRHLSVYTLIMLGESDTTMALLSYRIPAGDIRLMVPLTEMLKLWSHVHEAETDEVELDEVLSFHNALEFFCETTFGIKLGNAQFQQIKVNGDFKVNINSEIWSSSTRVFHVLLKYLTYLAVQRLNVNTLERMSQPVDASQRLNEKSLEHFKRPRNASWR